ncbi:MAG TPA: alpha/beta family hydrolase [Planctomycetota bacterium]|nr:alpha/beta family hydrolase [Planctomycetota bacterium]
MTGVPATLPLLRPEGARWLLVLAHGAGAGARHPFLEGVAEALAVQRIATLRYEFPYMAAGKKRPDRQPVLLAAVRAAVAEAAAHGLPLLAGGKSMGGRMTTLAAAEGGLAAKGIVLLGFPLHAAGKPSVDRAEHLARVPQPTLFVQGTRDKLGGLDLLRPVLPPTATLHVVEGADHGFAVKGRGSGDVLKEIAAAVARWADALD